jgi:hypothetical protein
MLPRIWCPYARACELAWASKKLVAPNASHQLVFSRFSTAGFHSYHAGWNLTMSTCKRETIDSVPISAASSQGLPLSKLHVCMCVCICMCMSKPKDSKCIASRFWPGWRRISPDSVTSMEGLMDLWTPAWLRFRYSWANLQSGVQSTQRKMGTSNSGT